MMFAVFLCAFLFFAFNMVFNVLHERSTPEPTETHCYRYYQKTGVFGGMAELEVSCESNYDFIRCKGEGRPVFEENEKQFGDAQC